MTDDRYGLYSEIEAMEGWLLKPAAHFTIDVLAWQEEQQITGGILEIGVYCGKYFTLLTNSALRANSSILGIDTFQFHSQQRVRDELAGVLGVDAGEKPILWTMPSVAASTTAIEEVVGKCRFISIDGAHDYDNVFRDLVLAEQLVSFDGLIAADDFINPVAIGVNQAVNAFLSQPRAVVPVAYTGNKLFLAHRARAELYRTVMESFLAIGEEPFAQLFRTLRESERHHMEQYFHGSRMLVR